MSVKKNNAYYESASGLYHYDENGTPKTISVGADYSAGEGIKIDNKIISVSGEYLASATDPSLAGQTLGLKDNTWVPIPSSENLYPVITAASANAYESAINWVENQHYLTEHQEIPSAKWEDASEVVQTNSAQWSENTGDEEVNQAVYNNSAKWNEIEVYEQNSASYLTAHQDISNKLDSTAFSTVSATFLTAINIPESATWNDVSTTVQSNSAQWSENTGDTEVNNYVYNNSGYIDNTVSTVQTNSSTWDNVTDKLDTTAFSTVSGSFLTAINIPESARWEDVADKYQENSASYATTSQLDTASSYLSGEIDKKFDKEDITAYATNDWVSSNFLSSNALDSITGLSGKWDNVSDTVIDTSAKWNEVSAKVDSSAMTAYYTKEEINTQFENTSAWANETFQPKGDYLTADALTGVSGNWNDTFTAVTATSANWNSAYEAVTASADTWNSVTAVSSDLETLSDKVNTLSGELETASATLTGQIDELSGAIDTVSGIVDEKLDITAFDNFKTSAATEIGKKLDTTAFTAWSAQTTGWDVSAYSAGANIDITNHVISGKDWLDTITAASAYASAVAYEEVDNTFGHGLSGITGYNGSGLQPLNYYTKDEVDDLFADFGGYEFVNTKPDGTPDLPQGEQPDTKTIYLTLNNSATGLDRYFNWIYKPATDEFVCVGDTTVDLSDYYKKNETSSKEELYEEFTATTDWVNNNFSGKDQLTAEFDKYIQKTDSANWDVIAYTGINGIGITNHEVSITANYLTADALTGVSGNWNAAYDTLTSYSAQGTWLVADDITGFATKDLLAASANALSGHIDYVSGQVDTKLPASESANYMKISGLKANTDGEITGYEGSAFYVPEDTTYSAGKYIEITGNDNVINVTGLHNTIVSSDNDTIIVTTSANQDTGDVAYILEATYPPISGINGISADYIDDQYVVGLENYNDIGFAKFDSEANTFSTSSVVTGYSQKLNINPTKIELSNDEILLKAGFYHVDVQTNFTITTADNNYYDVVVESPLAGASVKQMIDASYTHTETVDLSFDIRITTDDTPLEITVDNYKTGETFNITNLNVHEIVSMPAQIIGNENNYEAGDAIDITTNNVINVKYDSTSGLEIDPTTNKLYIKLGEGLKFDTSGAAAGSLALSNVAQEVVETVQSISDDLDTKVTTNFPPAMIIKTDCDVAEYRGAGTLYGNLFNVSINSVIEIDRTMLGVYIYQVDNDKNVILGLYEYQPDYPRYNNEDPTQGISGYGRTVALCDTGVITIPQGTVGFCEYPIKNLNNTIGTPNEETKPSLKSSCMYYATIFMGSDMNSDGLKLYGVTGYAPQVNQIKPGLNICPQNYNLALNDASYSAQISFNDFGFGWKYDNYVNHYTQGDTTTATISYQERSDGNRFYMQIRNKPQTSNV